MTGKFRIAHFSLVVSVAFLLTASHTLAQQNETLDGVQRPVDRLALLELGPGSPNAPVASNNNEPVPFSISTMTGDVVPPFAAHPKLLPASTNAPKGTVVPVSFEENMPTEPTKVESVDDCCRELTEMIAGNPNSEISVDAKKRMIETALKMVARNVALKAEARITKLKADHALEMARMQAQMGQMRTTSSAVDQINRVAGPLSQILQKNYQQAVAMNLGNQQLSQALAQLGYQRLEDEARDARATRQRIRLTSPTPTIDENQWRIAQLTQQVSELQRQLQQQNRSTGSAVQAANYNQPLQPRRQPLEPLPQRQTNEYFGNQYQGR